MPWIRLNATALDQEVASLAMMESKCFKYKVAALAAAGECNAAPLSISFTHHSKASVANAAYLFTKLLGTNI